jgi:hypothetical protein
MSHFHRESAKFTTAVIRHFNTGRVSVEYCNSIAAADTVAIRAMDLPDCLYAYTVELQTRFSNLPVIARQGAPHETHRS